MRSPTTLATTGPVGEFWAGRGGSISQRVTAIQPTSRGVLFVAGDPARGNELAVLDGGQLSLLDLRSGPESSDPRGFFELGGVVLFVADDGRRGDGVYASDGTAAGTRRLADLEAVGARLPGGERVFQQVGNEAWFAVDGRAGNAIYATDGTTVRRHHGTTSYVLHSTFYTTRLTTRHD